MDLMRVTSAGKGHWQPGHSCGQTSLLASVSFNYDLPAPEIAAC